jgi:hypothetical protein
MTWAEFTAARQLLTEERVGTHLRAQDAREAADAASLTQAIRRQEGGRGTR